MGRNCEDGSGITGHSGFDDVNKNNDAADCSLVPLPQVTFTELQLPSVLGYVSLDVEGLENELIEAFPFESTCAHMWTIENEGRVTEASMQRLRDQGCSIVGKSSAGHDDFWRCDCKART